MITKTQLKAGLPFTYKTKKYTLNCEGDNYYVTDFIGYVGNVSSLGTKSFTLYKFVMGKMFKVKVEYRDCELVVE